MVSASLKSRFRKDKVLTRCRAVHCRCIFDPFNLDPPPPPPASMDDAETIKLSTANWFQKLTFTWLTPLLVLGYKRELTATDLPKMDETRESARLADAFEINFERRRREIVNWNQALEDGSYKPSRLQTLRWRLGSKVGLSRSDGKREVGIALALSDTFFSEFWMAGESSSSRLTEQSRYGGFMAELSAP